MRARGDLTVLSEPFSAYYYGPERATDRFAHAMPPDPTHDWGAILDEVLRATAKGKVFFKDMAYHVRGCLTPDLVGSFRNAFLIRHPRHTLPSLRAILPDFTLEEAGFEQQHRLMRLVIEVCPDDLVVIDGEELRRSPAAVVESFCAAVGLDFRPEALSWEPGLIPDWERWADWHSEVAVSTGIRPPGHENKSGAREGIPADIPADVYRGCVEHYEQMVELARAAGRLRDG